MPATIRMPSVNAMPQNLIEANLILLELIDSLLTPFAKRQQEAEGTGGPLSSSQISSSPTSPPSISMEGGAAMVWLCEGTGLSVVREGEGEAD